MPHDKRRIISLSDSPINTDVHLSLFLSLACQKQFFRRRSYGGILTDIRLHPNCDLDKDDPRRKPEAGARF